VSIAESLSRFKTRADVVVPRLVAADAAAALVRSSSSIARTTAIQVLQKLGEPGRARLDALAADPATKDLIP
jgi:hypothetical protein